MAFCSNMNADDPGSLSSPLHARYSRRGEKLLKSPVIDSGKNYNNSTINIQWNSSLRTPLN